MFNTGERMKQMRKMHHVTQDEMAALLGIGKRAYQNYEYNHATVTVNVLLKFLDALKISADDFLMRNIRKDGTAEHYKNPLDRISDLIYQIEKDELKLHLEIRELRKELMYATSNDREKEDND